MQQVRDLCLLPQRKREESGFEVEQTVQEEFGDCKENIKYQ
jgi:hypothetical protein